MKRIFFAAVFLVCFPARPAQAYDEWSRADVARQVVANLTIAADWSQTSTIAKNPDRFRERNPLLGEHPSSGRVDKYFLLTSLVHPAITHILPAKLRPYWQYATITVELACIGNNVSVGIRMHF